MEQHLLSLKETAQLISQGRKLLLAGDESLLLQLPEGDWIAGTSMWFIDKDGGVISKDKIFVNDITDTQLQIRIQSYDENTIQNLYNDGFIGGFSVLIVPPGSKTMHTFSVRNTNFENFATIPLIGWVACTQTVDGKTTQGKTFNKSASSGSTTKAVAMHVQLPEDKYADITTFNIYKQGDGDTIEFFDNSFEAKDVLINGKKTNFAEYIRKINLDTSLPLVANYNSALLNVSIQSVNEDNVVLYAPVFKGIEYRLASSMNDVVEDFQKILSTSSKTEPAYAAVCVLNFLQASLEGKKCGNVLAPVVFGEICYQLVNQTVVTLEIGSNS